METSLRFDSQTKHLKLFAKEKFSNDDNYVLTVRPPPALARVRPLALPPRPRRLASTESPRVEPLSFSSTSDPPPPSLTPPSAAINPGLRIPGH
jgi:hypothetical protein